MRVRLTVDPIDYASLVEEIRNNQSGAIVLFLGTVRDFSEGKLVIGLEYEAYPPMAEGQLNEIMVQAARRWPLQNAIVEHRYGRLALGDIAVAVVTACAHRAEAFDAARWIMDTIKEKVPIWKQENWADGAPPTWVHPGVEQNDKAHK